MRLKKNTKIGMTYFFTVGILRILVGRFVIDAVNEKNIEKIYQASDSLVYRLLQIINHNFKIVRKTLKNLIEFTYLNHFLRNIP